MLTKPPFFPAARPINAAKRGYSTYSTTYGIQRVSANRAGGSAQTLKSNRFRLGPIGPLYTLFVCVRAACEKVLVCFEK